MGYSGAGGKLIHEKNQKQKISWHCPFKQSVVRINWKKIFKKFSKEGVSASLKTYRDPYLCLDLSMHVNKTTIHLQ